MQIPCLRRSWWLLRTVGEAPRSAKARPREAVTLTFPKISDMCSSLAVLEKRAYLSRIAKDVLTPRLLRVEFSKFEVGLNPKHYDPKSGLRAPNRKVNELYCQWPRLADSELRRKCRLIGAIESHSDIPSRSSSKCCNPPTAGSHT